MADEELNDGLDRLMKVVENERVALKGVQLG